MLAERLGISESKLSTAKLGSTKKMILIARVPISSKYNGSWVDTSVTQVSKKKARLMVVEDEPKKGTARKESKGSGMVMRDDTCDSSLADALEKRSLMEKPLP